MAIRANSAPTAGLTLGMKPKESRRVNSANAVSRSGPPAFKSASQAALPIPPILLEGDEPPSQTPSGPGGKFVLSSEPAPAPAPSAETAELPEAYGTGRLLLVGVDPHCLYAHWDLTAEQQHGYRALAKRHQLVVRVYLDALRGGEVTEQHAHPESRHWFLHVAHAGAKYVAELGYYRADRQWRPITASEPVVTPRDTASVVTPIQFVTLPFDVPLPPVPVSHLAAPSPSGVAQGYRHAERIHELLPESRQSNLPSAGLRASEPVPAAPSQWTEAQERALAVMFGKVVVRHGISSVGEAGLVALAPAPAASAITSPAGGPVSSPMGVTPPEQREFWFNVNAELVIYGATEPTARVTIGGQMVRLRPDGTFTCRFSLPDGIYELPITAVSVRGNDARHARLSFSRSTEYHGDVGVQPPNPPLKPPAAGNLG